MIESHGSPIVVRTRFAEFRLLPSGYIQAILLREGQNLTLDDPAAEDSNGDYLVSGGREIRDFMLDLDHAKVSSASGRLGARGKRIEVSGKSQSSPSLQKTLAMEVYDDFPALALTTT